MQDHRVVVCDATSSQISQIARTGNDVLIVVEPILKTYVLDCVQMLDEYAKLPPLKHKKWYDFKKGGKRK